MYAISQIWNCTFLPIIEKPAKNIYMKTGSITRVSSSLYTFGDVDCLAIENGIILS